MYRYLQARQKHDKTTADKNSSWTGQHIELSGSARYRGAERELHLHFLRTPLELVPRDDERTTVGNVKLEANVLQAKGDGSQQAVGTGEYEVLRVR